LYLDSGSHTIV